MRSHGLRAVLQSVDPDAQKFTVRSRVLFEQRYYRTQTLTGKQLRDKVTKWIKSGNLFSMEIKSYDY